MIRRVISPCRMNKFIYKVGINGNQIQAVKYDQTNNIELLEKERILPKLEYLKENFLHHMVIISMNIITSFIIKCTIL